MLDTAKNGTACWTLASTLVSSSTMDHLLDVRGAHEISFHRPIPGVYPEVAVEQQTQNRRRPQVPAGPGKRRVSVHVLGVDRRAGIEQHADGLFIAECRSAVQWGLAPGAAVTHKAAGLHRFPGRAVRVGAAGHENLQD